VKDGLKSSTSLFSECLVLCEKSCFFPMDLHLLSGGAGAVPHHGSAAAAAAAALFGDDPTTAAVNSFFVFPGQPSLFYPFCYRAMDLFQVSNHFIVFTL
jgi:hypothetical protein